MKTFLTSLILSLLFFLGCSSGGPQGPGDYGGGDVHLSKVSKKTIELEVKNVNKVRKQLFNIFRRWHFLYSHGESHPSVDKLLLEFVGHAEKDKLSSLSEKQKQHINNYLIPALNKIYDENPGKTNVIGQLAPSVNHVLETNELEVSNDSACETTLEGREADESIFGSDPTKICISSYTLSKKLDNLNLSKAIFSLAIHGIAHKAGADENEARALEYVSYLFPDTLVFNLIHDRSLRGKIISHIERLKEIITRFKEDEKNKSSLLHPNDLSEIRKDHELWGGELLFIFKKEKILKQEFEENEARLKRVESRLLEPSKQSEVELESLSEEQKYLKKERKIRKEILSKIDQLFSYFASGKIAEKRARIDVTRELSFLRDSLVHLIDNKLYQFILGKEQKDLMLDLVIHYAYTESFFDFPIADTGLFYLDFNKWLGRKTLFKATKNKMLPFIPEGAETSVPEDEEDGFEGLHLLFEVSLEDMQEREYAIPRPGNIIDLEIKFKEIIELIKKLMKSLGEGGENGKAGEYCSYNHNLEKKCSQVK